MQEEYSIAGKQRILYISSIILFLGYTAIQTTLLWWHQFNLEYSIQDSLITGTVLTVTCFVIANAFQYYLPRRERYVYVLIYGLFMAAINLSISRGIMHWVIQDSAYLQLVDYSLPVRYCFHALLIVCAETLMLLWNIHVDNKENERRKADAERLAREAELYNLRQQLQPHFLFNSLNSIIALIGRKPEEARNMTFQLSDFLRGTLRKDDQQLIPLKEELEHLRLYLAIEQVRFGHRLDTYVASTELAESQLVPAMILQPLVENAIKFGLYDTTGDVHIRLSAVYEQNALVVEIQNPYDPQSNKPRSGTGFGLRGVHRRLYLLYGRTDLLETQAADRIFTSIIKIPQA
jgi:two-component system LytT family sensor kinase